MSASDIFSVTKKDGQWIVRRERDGTQVTFTNRDEAADYGRLRAKRMRPSQLIVHGEDGQIEQTIPFE